MTTLTSADTLNLPSYIAGKAVRTDDHLDVHYPFTGELVGQVAKLDRTHLDELIESGLGQSKELSRYDRCEILQRTQVLLSERKDEFAHLIRLEAGLCMRETRYEVGRALDVLQFAAMEALRDDGRVFSCDVSPQGKARKIFTLREPVRLVLAITPFNHPLNQVAHKLAPAIAAGAPIILKPSEKTPLTAIRFAELLYEAGLPGGMLSVALGSIDELVRPLIEDDRVEMVSFTGSVAVAAKLDFAKPSADGGVIS